MLTVGGVGGILSGLIGFAWWITLIMLFIDPYTAAGMLFLLIYGLPISGVFLIIHAIGFFGVGKKFGKGAATAAGVLGLLYGIFFLAAGILFLGATPETILASISMFLFAAIFGFIFAILAIVGFSGTEKGTLGLVGGILTLIGLSPIGFILMGACMFQQSKL